jgi:hypothetical protein
VNPGFDVGRFRFSVSHGELLAARLWSAVDGLIIAVIYAYFVRIELLFGEVVLGYSIARGFDQAYAPVRDEPFIFFGDAHSGQWRHRYYALKAAI